MGASSMAFAEPVLTQTRARRREIARDVTMSRVPGRDKGNSQAHRPKVLVVDDQAEIRELIRNTLDLFGIPSAGAADGLEALQICRTDPPDLITLDLAMPQLNGQGLLTELAADPVLSRIPVIVVSAYTLDLVRTAQVVRVLPKPFDVQELIEAINFAYPR